MTLEAFADRVETSGKTHIEERIHDPLIRIDDNLAAVWTPFEFLIDGKVDHCGTDLFSLIRKDRKVADRESYSKYRRTRLPSEVATFLLTSAK